MNFNEQLRAILVRLDTGGYLGFGGVDQAEREAHTLIEEAIGENETKWIEATPSQRTVAESRNALRAELRAKFNVEEG